MKYEFTTIAQNDFIGNSLSSVNLNYKTLEYWTNNISFSSNRLYKPLLNFYNFYGNFWKDAINYANSINAITRLSSFQTNVETNSAKWIKPITFFYPFINQYNANTLNTNLNQAVSWFRTQYPVLPNANTKPNFAENTRAFLYCLLFEEAVQINEDVTQTGGNATKNCRTQNRSGVVTCVVVWLDNVTCYSSRICPNYNGTRCQSTFTANCLYENNTQAVNRSIVANFNNYFKDRSEHDHVYCLQLIVKNCDWVLEKIL
jgi:hypothetical protein